MDFAEVGVVPCGQFLNRTVQANEPRGLLYLRLVIGEHVAESNVVRGFDIVFYEILVNHTKHRLELRLREIADAAAADQDFAFKVVV